MKACAQHSGNLKINQSEETIHRNIQLDKEETEEVVTTAIKEFYDVDLYVIGKLWIGALQMALIGTEINLFPVIKAAKAPDIPQRPPEMKYTDLPLYQSPHYEYKDYVKDKEKCPDANVKLLHRYLLPHVKRYRRNALENFCSIKCRVQKISQNTSAEIRRAKNDFKQKMRDPNNLAVRQGVVATGGIAGYLVGGGGGIPRRLFCTSLGLLSTGALCFPKETDEIFRNFSFCVGKAFLAFYNNTCGKEVNLRERLACRDELPPPAPPRKSIPCPPAK